MTVLEETQHEDPRGEEKPLDLRPYLCIPYWTAPLAAGGGPDTGEQRPLPGNVISWFCPAIHATPYRPGQRLDVQVELRNSGAGGASAVATVLVYWADAATGFSHPTLFGSDSVAVQPRGGTAITGTISRVIPSTASDHICLLCVVTHSLDKAGKTANPVGDRHWAQRNLAAVGAAPGTPAIVPVIAANPLDHEAGFQLSAQMLEFDLLGGLARQLGGAATDTGMHVRLLDERGTLIGEGPGAQIDLVLDAGGQRLFNVSVEPLDELGEGELTAAEAVLLSNELEHPAGSLGIVLRRPGHR